MLLALSVSTIPVLLNASPYFRPGVYDLLRFVANKWQQQPRGRVRL